MNTTAFTPSCFYPRIDSAGKAVHSSAARASNSPVALRAVSPSGIAEVCRSEAESRLVVRAKAAVEAAVRRGAIPSRNFTLRALWLQHCSKSQGMIALLDSIPGNQLLEPNRPV